MIGTKKPQKTTKHERKAFYGIGPSGKPNPAGNRHERRNMAAIMKRAVKKSRDK